MRLTGAVIVFGMVIIGFSQSQMEASWTGPNLFWSADLITGDLRTSATFSPRWLSHPIFVNLCETTDTSDGRSQTGVGAAAHIDPRMIRTREQWQEIDCLLILHNRFTPLKGPKEEQDYLIVDLKQLDFLKFLPVKRSFS